MPSGCWEWQDSLINGYGRFKLECKFNMSHRVSYEIHYGPIPSGMHVLHKCDNRKCVNPDHLFIGTNYDNVKDKVAKNRQSRIFGNKNINSKLTEQAVLEIRNSNETQENLAKKYNIHHTTIGRIKNRKIWPHI